MLAILAANSAGLFAQGPALPLWPNGAPGGPANLPAEADITTAKDGLIAGKPVIRLGNVASPTLTIYEARQNKSGAVVVVFPDTALPQAEQAVEKVRRVLGQVRANGSESPTFCAAVCDVPLGPNFDAVDGVTEVINRLEVSLDHAQKEGGNHLLISNFAD